jgi:hypothetical protein
LSGIATIPSTVCCFGREYPAAEANAELAQEVERGSGLVGEPAGKLALEDDPEVATPAIDLALEVRKQQARAVLETLVALPARSRKGHVAGRPRRITPELGGCLQQHHAGAGARGLERGAHPSDAASNDDDVRVGPPQEARLGPRIVVVLVACEDRVLHRLLLTAESNPSSAALCGQAPVPAFALQATQNEGRGASRAHGSRARGRRHRRQCLPRRTPRTPPAVVSALAAACPPKSITGLIAGGLRGLLGRSQAGDGSPAPNFTSS